MVKPEEREKILFSFNDTRVDYSGPKNYCELFHLAVNAYPKQTAVVYQNKSLTYSELNNLTNQIANYLISKGVKKDDLIGICLDRSIEMISGILGILKAGAAYLPIDPEYPAERINFMLEDSDLKIILTDQRTSNNSEIINKPGLEVIVLDSDQGLKDTTSAVPETKIDPEDLAYVIYTSGSTGRPKGVMNEHRGLVNRLNWTQSFFNLGQDDVVLQKTTFCFDVSVWELLWPLMVGAKLVLARPGGQKDSQYLEELIDKEQVSTIHFVPSMLEIFLLGIREGSCKNLRRVLCSGEELFPHQLALFGEKLGHVGLFNLYGPTEAAIDVTCWPAPLNAKKVYIGKPVANTSIYILDQDQEPCAIGEEGELFIGGVQVARGYLNRPELNESRFLKNPFAINENTRLYRSGDLARWLEDGTIEYLGRADEQVKIRGFRIEPGEIENVILEFGGIRQCLVHVKGNENPNSEKKLIAYIVGSEGKYNKEKLAEHLRSRLPEYMIPSLFMDIPELPLSSNGKVDRKALPVPGMERPDLQVLYKAPISEIEKLLAKLWASVLSLNKVGVNDNFFELGGNSLLALRFVAMLKQQHQLNLPVTRLYQDPYISKLALFLGGKTITQRTDRNKNRASGTDIAVIGMSGRFPGASGIEELWDVLQSGKETTSFFSDEELDSTIPPALSKNPDYVKARGVLEQAEYFDAPFFGMNSRMAELMDPQQRIFLEIAWEVLESTGHLPERYDGKVGVFAGSGTNTYYLNNVHTRPDLIAAAGAFQVSTLNEKDYIAMRTAFELDLKGPAVSVYSACSTSLLAIAQAVESLRKGQCDVALAGGSSVTAPIRSGHLYEEGAILSKDGHCRPFDTNASGTVFSDGAGVVLLKNREDAERDGDTIYAIIKGVGLNNDGAMKASFTAPNAGGQADTISMAIADAGIDASSISYVETHGTATPLGDPIEIEGLKMAFGSQEEKQFCALGSIKSNMGHLTQAAGVAGFIKTTLALHHKQIPPSLFFEQPNPGIDFENSPFYVNAELSPWESTKKRRAGISSFGVGGTNVHVILEEAEQKGQKTETSYKAQLICWSANSEDSLNQYASRLSDYLKWNPQTELSDIAWTLQSTRRDFAQRRFIIAGSTADLAQKLSKDLNKVSDTKILKESATELAFIFPGQGSQYLNMGVELYNQEKIFRDAVDECASLLLPWFKEDIRTILYTEPAEAEKIHNTRYTQPALFVTEYAMAKLWMSWGIRPAALCGHSIGEFAAAHLAGIFSLEDALKLVSERARLASELEGGSMLAVKALPEEIEKQLTGNLSIAAYNSPDLSVVSGPSNQIEIFSAELQVKSIPNVLIKTSHAFHSSMMDGMKENYSKVVHSVTLNPPRIPLVSSVTGKWMTEAEACSASYWINQIRLPVRFTDAISTLWEEPTRLLLEVGPGNAATTFAKQQSRGTALNAISGFEVKGDSEYVSVLRSLGKLWQNGIIPDWLNLYEGNPHIIKLPNYAFDRKRCWVEPGQTHYSTIQTDALNKNSQSSQIENINLSRKEVLIQKISRILENASGIEMKDVDPNLNFIEIGLDSLLLTQVAITLKREFSLPISFRQLNEDLNTLNLLADFLEAGLPADSFENAAVPETGPESEINRQITELNRKLDHIRFGNLSPSELSPEEEKEIKKPFGASPRIEKQSLELNPVQTKFLNDLIERYNRKTRGSKEYTQKHRAYMADPRVVSGFRPLTKEIIYPIVVKKSKGSRIWDLDDNEYIDALNGFGSNMLGFQPDSVFNAIKDQMDKGYEIGPQHELAGEVCKLICEFTNSDRAALCSTGSEAVLGTMRIARTVSGRSLIVAFSGSYHGVFDEVIVRGTKTFRSIPAAAGIMPEAVQNMLILDYGTEESLKIIQERAHELAAVLVEPVQSRRPDFHPIDFLKKVREITALSGTVLIFDEVITGFRMHPGGAQALFGIKPDISSYGKVIGGGLPIGAIAGKKQYMDALDGGSWQYGDQSVPEAGVTYFAGTFVRHPLALAAAKSSLEYFKLRGPSLQEELSQKAAGLMSKLNSICKQLKVPISVVGFGSMWKIRFDEEIPYSELLFTLMREKGIHIWDGFPCFMTESHTGAEIDSIIEAFDESLEQLIAAGFIESKKNYSSDISNEKAENEPPVSGARLGRDWEGNPAWFIADPENPGKYLQVKHN